MSEAASSGGAKKPKVAAEAIDSAGVASSTIHVPIITTNSLGAPLACFDEGFSSEGAFVSGAETDRGGEVTPTDSDNALTPRYELPRFRTPQSVSIESNEAMRLKMERTSKDGQFADSGHDQTLNYSQSEEDLGQAPAVAPAQPPASSKRRTHEEELMEAMLLGHQDSFDIEVDEPMTPVVGVPMDYQPTLPTSTRTISSAREEQRELRRQYETRATSRPRSRTPVRTAVLEEFVATTDARERERVRGEREGLRISLPGQEERGKQADYTKP